MSRTSLEFAIIVPLTCIYCSLQSKGTTIKEALAKWVRTQALCKIAVAIPVSSAVGEFVPRRDVGENKPSWNYSTSALFREMIGFRFPYKYYHNRLSFTSTTCTLSPFVHAFVSGQSDISIHLGIETCATDYLETRLVKSEKCCFQGSVETEVACWFRG